MARRIVHEGPGDLHPSLKAAGGVPFGHFWAFGEAEQNALKGLVGAMKVYLEAEASKPLSVAVFGPPGCGKSFAVEELVAHVGEVSGKDLSYAVLNLTQLRDISDLATALALALIPARKKSVPIIFFDEFDASRDGTRLGWLAWFLAPMNDGVFRRDGVPVRTGPAVFIFAGGTCHRATEFVGRADSAFRAAKGPDFASRLAATFDVPGPNAFDPQAPKHRRLRRALLIANALGDKREALGMPGLDFDAPLLEQLLGVDRYTHGARSVKLCVQALTPPSDWDGGPITHAWQAGRLDAFFDRGPFDPAIVGGGIQLCGGADEPLGAAMGPFWHAVGQRLIDAGATLLYGGRIEPGGDNLTSVLQSKASTPPPFPTGSGEGPNEREIRLRLFDQPPDGKTRVDAIFYDAKAAPAPGLEQQTLESAAAQFQKRLYMVRQSVACVAIGGKVQDWSGRMPGLLEEITLAAMHGRPLYLVGGAGMAVGDIGALLGLTATWTGTPDWLTKSGPLDQDIERSADRFRWPGAEDAPVTTSDAVDTLRRFALGSPGWNPNGLTPAENRELFAATDGHIAAALIMKGLEAILPTF